MTQLQVNKLISDKDIIPDDNGWFCLEGVKCDLSIKLTACLGDIFDWYLEDYLLEETELYESVINSRLSLLSDAVIKKQYLTDKLLKALSKLDDHRKDYYHWDQSSARIKDAWFFLLVENPETSRLIECLKFTVLSGRDISDYGAPVQIDLPKRHELDEFFTTDGVLKLYSDAYMEHQIVYLQQRILEVDRPAKKKFEKEAQPEAAAVAIMSILYNKKIAYDSQVRDIMLELGLGVENLTPKYIKIVVEKSREIFDEEGIILQLRKHPNSRINRLKHLQSIIPLIEDENIIQRINYAINALDPAKAFRQKFSTSKKVYPG